MTLEEAEQSEPLTVGEWERLVRAAEQRGDLLGAYDLASEGLAAHPGSTDLQYRAVLNLSRSGANDRAAALYADYRLEAQEDERVASLGARIVRERALAIGSAALLGDAAQHYDLVYERTGGTFPGINAASLYLLAGDDEAAKRLAGEVLASCTKSEIKAYATAADATAAALIVGDLATAKTLVGKCRELHEGNYIAVAATRRQLKQICDKLRLDRAIIEQLAPKMVIHFVGHLISPPGVPGRFPAKAEPQVARHIANYLGNCDVGYGFGSLACGADILFAEALLSRGAELNVVLPFALDEFRSYSVARGGGGWEERFDECLARASSVTYATDDEYLGDRVLLRHASQLAMGLALLRADYLEAPVTQVSVWDGNVGSRAAGTVADIEYWRGKGLPSHTIDSLPSVNAELSATVSPASSPSRPGHVVKSMLFGDAKGFAKLRERQIPAFVEYFLGRFNSVLDRYGDRVEFRNTWGDGLYLVMDSPVSAMNCALDLQAEVATIDRAAVGLPADLGLRIGCHAGPVFSVTDPILGVRNYTGSHVSRTARIEPVTPEGQVYGTEAFAALIALERDPTLTCEYVGVVPAAKHYGSFRMYLLKRQQHTGSPR